MRIHILLLAPLLFFLSAQAQKTKVVVLGFDGLGGIALSKANTPHINELKKNGVYTYHARSVFPTVSSPNWAAMVNGAPPRINKIRSNAWERKDIADKQFYDQTKGEIFPTIFKLLRQQQPSSTIKVVHQWGGFARLINTEVLDTCINTSDEFVTCTTACEIIEKGLPDLLFVHFDHVDHAGHEQGHFSSAYYSSIAVADSLIGAVVNSLKKTGQYDNTYILITADHGGINKGHGGATHYEFAIPWILSGKQTHKAKAIKGRVRQFDTAPTLAYILGLSTPACWKGRPIAEAFSSPISSTQKP